MRAAKISMTYFRPAYYAIRFLADRHLKRLCKSRRAIVLTYDDGPGARLSQSLSKLLLAHDARGTFFLLGRRVVMDTDTVELLARDGHELGCHSYDHLHAWKTSASRAVADINAGYDAVSRWVNPGGLFRPPHGKLSYATWRALRRRGARTCWWTLDSGDTWPVLPTPQSVVDSVLHSGGGVVLMHDFDRGPDREKYVLNTTEALLAAAERESMQVLTFSQVFAPQGSLARTAGG